MPIIVPPKQTERDRKELDRFVKNYIIRIVYAILQSRYDEPESTPCRAKGSPSDWFHLNVPEVAPEISEQLKSVWNQLPQKQLSPSTPVCVDLILFTKDNEKIVLETWEMGWTTEPDLSCKSTYEVYCRMCTVLKSLICISRIVPAYRLALAQNDDYRLHYLIYSGPPREDLFGENYRTLKVGNVGMQHGTVTINVRHRTKLVYNRKEKPEKPQKMMVKSDYYPKPLYPNENGEVEHHGQRFDFAYPLSSNGQRNPARKLNKSSPYGAFAGEPKEPAHDNDLCDMFGDLILDPEETDPSQAPEADDYSDDELRASDMANGKNNSDKYVYIDLKPAFAEECSSELGIFFMQPPVSLKSLTETAADETHKKENSETLVKQVEQMKVEIQKQEFDQFFDQVCGAEA